jgi:hypothetical protein
LRRVCEHFEAVFDAAARRLQPHEKPLVDAMQGESRFESAAYTGVREHFETAFNAAARRQRLFFSVC